MLGALEMLQRGITSVQDDAFLMPFPNPRSSTRCMQAYADSGIRAAVALDQPELPEAEKLPFLDGLDAVRRGRRSTPRRRPPPPQLLAAYDHLIGSWHGAADGRLRAAVSVSAPQRVSPEYFAALDDLSRAPRPAALRAHAGDQGRSARCRREQPRFGGRSLVRYTADSACSSERTNVIHAVWVDDADLDLIAAAGRDGRAQPGQQPAPRQRRHAVAGHARPRHPDRLGVDEAICDDAVNMWAVVKTAGLIHNISGPRQRGLADRRRGARRPLAGRRRARCGGPATSARSRSGMLADLALLDLHASRSRRSTTCAGSSSTARTGATSC